MIISSSSSFKGLALTAGGLRRLLIGAVGVATLAVAVIRAPTWDNWWSPAAIAAVIAAAALVLVLALFIAVRGSARVVERITIEAAFCAAALLAAEAVLLARAPENWSEEPIVRRLSAQEQAARAQGIAYDGRVPAEVVDYLRSQGVDAIPGFAQGVIASPALVAAITERGLAPLSNAANAVVVECNEGPGYLKFRSDRFGFNNPPGLAIGPVDVAVIGESLALGHCVPPNKSTVDRLRAQIPRTANFGVAGSRVLSQLGVFREYVEPLHPPVVLWFVNMNFAQPRHESRQPLLMRYLEDPSFSQGLRERQQEVDALVREVAIPVTVERDRALRAELDSATRFPLRRVFEFDEVRGVVGFDAVTRRPPTVPNLSVFARATQLIAETAGKWGGRVVVVMLPSYELSAGEPQAHARYDAVSQALQAAGVEVVDGPAVFAAHPDFLELFTLGMDNHPNERGHAALAHAIIATLNAGEKS
jgi:hypothetical protein